MTADKVCILGAGSSGIAAAKLLQEHRVPYDCFEKGSGIGGNWRYQNDNGMSAAYASLHINTSKTRMAYSDFPMPEDYPDYPHHRQILDYFEGYVDHFGIRPQIRFHTSVESVEPDDGGWRVTVSGADSGSRRYAAVLVCNGHHWDAKLPDFPGSFAGRTLHAHDYRTPEGMEDKNVLVVGIGNSGVDVACESARVSARTFLSTRRSAHVVPKYVWGKPIDQLTSPAGSLLPLAVQNFFLTTVLRLARGPQTAFGLPDPEHRLLQAHPTVSADLLNLIGRGRIAVKPDVDRLDGGTVRFADGSEEKIDVVVYATGYKVRFPFLAPELVDSAANEIRLYRYVVHPTLPGLYFIGLVQPLGAVMPLAEAQSEWVAKLLTGECALPDRDAMEAAYEKDRAAMRRRYVRSTRHTLQVDFFPYMKQIKKEIRRGRKLARRKPAAKSAIPNPSPQPSPATGEGATALPR